jgi:hypothetical protein
MDKVEKRRIYREANKEILKEKSKLYYNTKKDSILQKRKELVNCDVCNCQVTRESMFRHKLSKTHLANSTPDSSVEINN